MQNTLARPSKALDFVTVTFGEELGLLQIQARSFAEFMLEALVNNILLVVNEASPEEVIAHIVENIVPLYGIHASKVRVLPRSELSGGHAFKHRGWISQQVLKLLASHQVAAEAYVILDTKNHFVRQIVESDFLSENQRLKHRCVNLKHGKRSRWTSWFLPAKTKKLSRRYVGSMQYFGLTPLEFAENSVPKTTPFPMHTELVRDMIIDIEKREGEAFPAWFERYFEATEFYLLQAYAAFRGYSFHDLYEASKPGVLVLYPEAKKRLARLAQTLAMVENSGRYFCLGVHRKLATCLSKEQKQLLTDFWRKRGLISEEQHFDTLVGALPTSNSKSRSGANEPDQKSEVSP